MHLEEPDDSTVTHSFAGTLAQAVASTTIALSDSSLPETSSPFQWNFQNTPVDLTYKELRISFSTDSFR
jgi:hypothetical protein